MDKLDRLIEILCAERGVQPQTGLNVEGKRRYFRALCNVRPPLETSEEFLRLQDEYLTGLIAERGIVRADSLRFEDGIALYRGDITALDADAIVNAGNDALLGCFVPLHGCIDNAVHSFAGVQVRLDCDRMMKGGRLQTGEVRVTGAYNLPSKFIFHTVGPIVGGVLTQAADNALKKCYVSCLEEAGRRKADTLAFCCISTGVFGFPSDAACRIAVDTVRERLDAGLKLKVIFDVFTEEDERLYERRLRR